MKTDKNKRLLLFGMELHIITDAFAHRFNARKLYINESVPGNWEHVGKPKWQCVHIQILKQSRIELKVIIRNDILEVDDEKNNYSIINHNIRMHM